MIEPDEGRFLHTRKVRLDRLRIHPNALCEIGRFEDIRILRENAVWPEANVPQDFEVQRFQILWALKDVGNSFVDISSSISLLASIKGIHEFF